MTATTSSWRGLSWSSLRDDTRQFIAVLVVLAVALVLALALKGVVESQTRVVRGGGISASVPADWVYQPGAGDLAFVVNDPREPGHRYVVSRIAAGERGLAAAVDTFAGAKGQLLTAYQGISRTPTTIGNRSGEAVTYAYVIERDGRIPQVIQARDVYLADGDRILVISNEGSADGFEAGLPAFEQFVRSVGN